MLKGFGASLLLLNNFASLSAGISQKTNKMHWAELVALTKQDPKYNEFTFWIFFSVRTEWWQTAVKAAASHVSGWLQCVLMSTEGRVDTNVIETGPEFRLVRVNSTAADNSKKANEALTSPLCAARSAVVFSGWTHEQWALSGINLEIKRIHANISRGWNKQEGGMTWGQLWLSR